jgi:hypothetical protein
MATLRATPMSVAANLYITIMGGSRPVKEIHVHPDTWRAIIAESPMTPGQGEMGDTFAGIPVVMDIHCPENQVITFYAE